MRRLPSCAPIGGLVPILWLVSCAGPSATGIRQDPPPAPEDPSASAGVGAGAQEPGSGPGRPENPFVDPVAAGADDEDVPPARHRSLDIGVFDTGVSFGNSECWNGLRFGVRDHDVASVRGLNVSLWHPVGHGIGHLDGIGIGVAPSADHANGIRVGLGAALAGEEANGLQFGTIVNVADGAMRGVNLAGVAVQAHDLQGIQFGGIATLATDELQGVSLAGVAMQSEGDVEGVQISGVALIAGRDLEGISFGGVTVQAEENVRGIQGSAVAVLSGRDLEGVSFGGITVQAEDDVRGIQVAGVAVLAQGELTGISVGGVAVSGDKGVRGLHVSPVLVGSPGRIEGIAVGGALVGDSRDAFWDLRPRRAVAGEEDAVARGLLASALRVDIAEIQGVSVAGIVNRSHRFDGLAVAAHNSVGGLQRGVSIGLFNHAEDLRGVQIGLLNHVPSNPWWARWLPLVNARF